MKEDMKEKLIMWGLACAWAAGTGVVSYILTLNNDIIALNSEITYLQKSVEQCVQRDIYEVDKLLMIERLRKDH